MQKVQIYSDGSARGNPSGPGGYGTIVNILNDNGTVIKTEEFAKGFPVTTNNRMELMGVIAGLESLKEVSEVSITSDSSYVVNAFNQQWINKWISNGWKTSNNNPVKNVDLWQMLLNLKSPHKVNFIWVKGHNGHPQNERCDKLATAAADGKNMTKNDKGLYEIEG